MSKKMRNYLQRGLFAYAFAGRDITGRWVED